MKRAIFRRCVLVALAALLLSAAVSSAILYAMRMQEMKSSMLLLLKTVKSQIEYDISHGTYLPGDEVGKYNEYRLSIVDGNGKVLADSRASAAQMDNHANRPELVEAKQSGVGSSVRYSATLGGMFTYMAMRVSEDLYIRLAMEIEVLNAIFKSLLPSTVIGLVFAAAITPFIASRVTERITQPLFSARDRIEQITLDDEPVPLPTPQYEELAPIMDSVNTLSMRIHEALGQLQDERERTKTLLDNMEEGLAVIDSRLRVSSINNACERYMGASNVQGRNIVYLTRDKKVQDAIEIAVRQGRSTIFDLPSHEEGRILSVRITPARGSIVLAGAGREERGAILLLTDVTTVRANERMRSEFVANASHELKTPITSIKGFADLLASGLVEGEQTKVDYLGRITAEATRMTSLINDIIKLSELENGKRPETEEQVDICALARELAERLAPIAKQKDVAIAVTGEKVLLRARREELRQIVSNLMENAVKYNKQGGSVTVSCRSDGETVSVTVADTGIGIAREHHARVFERFYCVDKGRSRTVGGTGLGLSIVKHAVASLGGEILFESRVGVGTTITVVFGRHTKRN